MKTGIAARLLMGLGALVLLAAPASAQAILTNGTIAIGIDTLGQMNVPEGLATDGVTNVTPENASRVGLSFLTDYGSGLEWNDATSPGCFCEGYGVSVTGHTGYADNDFAILNISGVSFSSSATDITVETELTSLPGLDITHLYQASASASLFEAVVTITNNTGVVQSDLRYNRTMDWDVPPTTFDEFVTLQGWAGVGDPLGDLIDSCNDGFETPNPLTNCTSIGGAYDDVNFTDVGPFDHGARFTFGFGDLAAGASKTFSIFYGAAISEAAAFAALAAAGAEGIYSFGQSNGGEVTGAPATFIFGFGGVGAPPIDPTVPEPVSMLLLGGGLAGVLVRRYRRS